MTALLTACIEFMEREAGYHSISLALIIAGMAFSDPSKRAELAHDLVVFGTGVLARSMSARQKPAAGTTTVTTS